MKLDSKFFDRIRIKPDQETIEAGAFPRCEWAGCEHPAPHRAPKGRLREGQYYNFCLDHVRIYNKSYNYFSGMRDDAVSAYQKDAQTGHRPTWTMGVNPQGWRRGEEGDGPTWAQPHDDAYFVLRNRFRATSAEPPPEPPRRKLKRLELKSLEVLDLGERATGEEIKARYKTLVKRHHPDANGGDRSSEGRLQEIIQAYNHLKTAGLC